MAMAMDMTSEEPTVPPKPAEMPLFQELDHRGSDGTARSGSLVAAVAEVAPVMDVLAADHDQREHEADDQHAEDDPLAFLGRRLREREQDAHGA